MSCRIAAEADRAAGKREMERARRAPGRRRTRDRYCPPRLGSSRPRRSGPRHARFGCRGALLPAARAAEGTRRTGLDFRHAGAMNSAGSDMTSWTSIRRTTRARRQRPPDRRNMAPALPGSRLANAFPGPVRDTCGMSIRGINRRGRVLLRRDDPVHCRSSDRSQFLRARDARASGNRALPERGFPLSRSGAAWP
jgi:hypothetical protein